MVALPSAVSRYLPEAAVPLLGAHGARRGRGPGAQAPVRLRLRHRVGPALPGPVARAALVEAVARPAVQALARPQLHGLDRLDPLVEAGDPVIFAANHHSHVDTPLLACSVPEPWRHRLFVAAAADYFFRTRVTSVLSALVIGAIPIDRSRVSRRSADRAAGLIEDGWSMLIFPEGGRSPDGWGQPFRGGAAYLALRCGVAVVPVHLQGTGRILRKGRKLPTPATPGSPSAPR